MLLEPFVLYLTDICDYYSNPYSHQLLSLCKLQIVLYTICNYEITNSFLVY